MTTDQPRTAFQYLARAKANLTPQAWDYLMGGSETETSLNRNRRALDSLAFRFFKLFARPRNCFKLFALLIG